MSGSSSREYPAELRERAPRCATRGQSLRATDGTAALLSCKPDTVDKDLGAARDRLTGEFKDSHT
jgi:Mce-associated membrane protein